MLKVHTKNFGQIVILFVYGRITIGETDTLRNVVLAQTNAKLLILDLARVSTIDAHGLGVMLELRARCETKGIGFKLRNLTIPVRSVLEITRLNTVFEVISQLEFVTDDTDPQGTDMMELATSS